MSDYQLNDINKNSTVLDVGCGTGGFTLELARHSKQVIGIDISKINFSQEI